MSDNTPSKGVFMAALMIPRQESFAKALAEGLTPDEAAEMAGYKGEKKQARHRARQAKFVERVAELRRRRDWGGSSDVGPLIDELMKTVQEARKLDTAAAFVAIRGLIVEAARLKQTLREFEPEEPLPPPLTTAEWVEKYAPKKA
jgi:hypothetical protein